MAIVQTTNARLKCAISFAFEIRQLAARTSKSNAAFLPSNLTKGNQLGSSFEAHAIRIPSANSTTASIPYTKNFTHALELAFQTTQSSLQM